MPIRPSTATAIRGMDSLTFSWSANAPPAGQQFAAWIGDTNILPQGDAFQASTTATMPPQNVSLTATYSVSGAATGTGLRGQYYNDASNTNYSSGLPNPFTGSPVLTRNDATVDFDCRLRWTPPGQQEQTIPSIYLSPPAGTQVAAPVFNPTPGTYSSAQSVTITSATAGAFIRYTMDGSTPSASVGTLYSGPVPVGSTMTLKAMAFKTGMDDSAVTSGTYTINSVPTYTLTVTNGTGSGSYAQGYQASVSANPPPAGQVFAGWIGNTELLAGQDATRASTTATMTKNASLTATYSTSGGAGTGLQGQYYNDGSGAVYSQSPPLGLANPFTSAPVLTRYDAQVDFNWGANSPGSGVNVNNFSAKWTGRVKALVSGSYIFRVTADDGVRLFFNGVQVIDGWKDQSQTIYTYTTLYKIELHYYEHGDAAVCQLHWIPPGQPDQAVPQSQLYPPSAPAPAGGLVTFEGTGIPTLWVDGSTGNTIDWDYTAAPLVGAQSLFMPDPASGDRWANYNYSEVSDTIYVAFWFRTSALPSAEFPIFEVLDSGNNALASVRLMTNGNVVIRADAVSSASIITMSTNTTYRIKVRYVRGTGANETIQAWCNTNASGAWSSTQTLSNGTSTLQADRASFYNSPNINVNMTIDNVLVKTTDIAWPEIN
jgi:PA14 domain/Chitobiase/beta-hexosaminidase C-terminal domain/Divergent InlB B-repeat domain